MASVAARGIAIVAAIVLAGCGSAPKRSGGFYQGDGPPAQVPADIMATPDAVPRIEPFHPYANRPYTALGRNYTPLADDRPLVQRGQASWYGRQFHGNRTASGEIYDMYAMTAAHPTMPLPSYARVTHLRNGASVVVRVNDRGPFKDGRVIDLSYAAAARLGILGTGIGEVEVARITHAEIAAVGTAPALPQEPGGRWSVQLGAFSAADRAQTLLARVQAELKSPQSPPLPADLSVRIEPDGHLHRVLLGALPDREAALALAARVSSLFGAELSAFVVAR